MPIPENFRPMLAQLQNATADKTVAWSVSTASMAFSCSLSSFSFRIQSVRQGGQSEIAPASLYPVNFRALDSNGQLIDEFIVNPNEHRDFELVVRLWDLARRSAKQIDDKIAQMMQELETRKPAQ